MQQAVKLLVLVAGVGIAAFLGSAGCGAGSPPAERVLFVGIDSADWTVIDPLMEQGRLPNLSALVGSGVSCDLHSLEPKQKSPTIWATIATGKLPEKHGITDYVDPTSKNLLTSNVRTARAIWDIVGERGLSVTVVGWLITWPAEVVNGSMVSDYFRFSPRPDRPLPERLTYPETLADDLAHLRVSDSEVTDEDLDRFIDLDAAMTTEETQRLPVSEMFLEMRGIKELEQRAGELRGVIAGDRTFHSATLELMETRPADVSIVYLRGVDTASHKFWAAAHPGEVGFPVSQTENRVFGKTVERYYEYADEMLGELIERFGEGTVVVCSDHGFEGPKPGVPPGGINDHGPIGILVMSGEAFKSGVRLPEQNVVDVTPTLLALLGMPIGEDMDGSVIEEAFAPGYLRSHPVRRIPTHEKS